MRVSFLLVGGAIFFTGQIYANPLKEASLLSDNAKVELYDGCLLSHVKGRMVLEKNHYSSYVLASKNSLSYNCKVGIFPAVTLTSFNGMSLGEDNILDALYFNGQHIDVWKFLNKYTMIIDAGKLDGVINRSSHVPEINLPDEYSSAYKGIVIATFIF